MPLLDHFHPPLSDHRHWHSFHNSWATYLSSQLNSCLPIGYFAEANVQFGVEVDVAAFEEEAASATSIYTPPLPTKRLPVAFSEAVVEIGIFNRSGGPRLAGAIELVSPANKDRPAHRDAFFSKCASYLQAGVGLVIVDVVTDRQANMHTGLLQRLGQAPSDSAASLMASAYRPIRQDKSDQLDIWYEPFQIGATLPTMPLWLSGGFCLPVELEATYERTCSEQRLRAVAG